MGDTGGRDGPALAKTGLERGTQVLTLWRDRDSSVPSGLLPCAAPDPLAPRAFSDLSGCGAQDHRSFFGLGAPIFIPMGEPQAHVTLNMTRPSGPPSAKPGRAVAQDDRTKVLL